MRKILYVLFAFFIANMAYAQTVEFQVDMSIKTLKGTFNPSSDTMNLAGTFNNWTVGATQMAGPNADTVYTVTIDTFAVGDQIAFKFVINSTGWENAISDRQYTVPAGNSVYFAYFDNDSIFVPLDPIPISLTFQCNMEFEAVSGRFDPANDTVSARGTFNGWGANDIMSPGLDPNIYEVTVMDTLTVGDNVNYKYVYIHSGVVNWESGSDRIYTITQDDYDNGFASISRTYNDLTLATITNAPCTIKFVTYMEGAINANTGLPFPSIDNVVLAGANPPLHWPNAGWPNEDSTLVWFLYDDGTHGDVTAGDNYWSRDIEFPIYSALDIEYKHGGNWGDPNNLGNDNEGGVGTNHHIVLDPHTVSATVIDTFGVNIGYHELQDEVLGIKELSSNTPETYSLSQNYPNPFNPTTMIRFSLKEQGNVSLKVYNVIGQLVATLVNGQKPAGTYEYNFDASYLSSGIYFYTIQAGDFTATRKMILMK